MMKDEVSENISDRVSVNIEDPDQTALQEKSDRVCNIYYFC